MPMVHRMCRGPAAYAHVRRFMSPILHFSMRKSSRSELSDGKAPVFVAITIMAIPTQAASMWLQRTEFMCTFMGGCHCD